MSDWKPAVNRLDLGLVNPAYKGLWIDVLAGLGGERKRKQAQIGAWMQQRRDEWNTKPLQERTGEMAPWTTEEHDAADNLWYAQFCYASNIQRSLVDGSAISGDVKTVGFWAEMSQDVKNAVQGFYDQKLEAAKSVRMAGELFTVTGGRS